MLELEFEKGPNLSGIDPETDRVVALYHPRRDNWDDHFSPAIASGIPLGIVIHGLTPVGRATVRVLGLNDEMRQLNRYELWIEGVYRVVIV